MTFRLVSITVLTAGLSILPVLYLHLVWSTVPALVATHSTNGVADQFASRQALWNVAWWPLLVFVTLTFWPQVQEGQSLFWSSPRQRQLRALIVGALVVSLTAALRYSIALGRSHTVTMPALKQAYPIQAR